MTKICYVARNFSAPSLAVIDHANTIIEEYAAQGFVLTLRQLYYQFVSRDLIPNKQSEYKRLGSIVNDARLAGLVSWEAIEDRGRGLKKLSDWERPEDIVAAVADQFRLDLWEKQPFRVEVWIEKEALAGVFERICNELRVPFFSCKGYTSQSEMWVAAMRLKRHARNGQTPLILHFGDHDPSGIDMTRDILDRIELMAGRRVEVRRLALNMEQIEEHQPPPNPAKESDSRFTSYRDLYGDESWELDALDPTILSGLVRDEVDGFRDADLWEESVTEEEEHKRILGLISEHYDDVVGLIGER